MAGRTKTPALSLPKNIELPEGCEFLQVERSLGKDKGKKVIQAVAPISGNADGLRNFITFVTEQAEKGFTKVDEKLRWNGVDFATAAIRNAVTSLSGDDLEADGMLVPAPSEPRTVDLSAVAMSKVEAFRRENGKMPNAKELAEIYASVGL